MSSLVLPILPEHSAAVWVWECVICHRVPLFHTFLQKKRQKKKHWKEKSSTETFMSSLGQQVCDWCLTLLLHFFCGWLNFQYSLWSDLASSHLHIWDAQENEPHSSANHTSQCSVWCQHFELCSGLYVGTLLESNEMYKVRKHKSAWDTEWFSRTIWWFKHAIPVHLTSLPSITCQVNWPYLRHQIGWLTTFGKINLTLHFRPNYFFIMCISVYNIYNYLTINLAWTVLCTCQQGVWNESKTRLSRGPN